VAATLLVEVGVAFAALAAAGALAHWIGLSVIPACIVVGVLVGPNPPTSVGGVSLTLVSNGDLIAGLAELGVVLLLFFLGLEFNVGQLVRDRSRMVRIGAIDLVANLGIGLLLGVAFGFSVVETLFLAGIVYISSSAIVTKSLIDEGWVANSESAPILGTLVFEDVVIAVYLAVLSTVALGGGTLTDAAVSVGVAFAFLGVLALAAWGGTGAIDRLFGTPSDELFLLRVLGVTTLVAGTALALGISEAVAAFFVGTAFSQTGHVERIEHVVAPARDVFAAVFFLSIGLTTDLTLLVGVADLLVAAVVLTAVTKFASGVLAGRVYDLDARRSVRVGLGLLPRGEFSLVIAALAASVGTGALGTVIPAFAVGYVLAMSVLGTVLIQQADVVEAVRERLAA
jgi:CPA2 family monovalent cation:H+ antiporter-2